jgi:hypothetical protein
MTFEDDIKNVYKNVINRNDYDWSNKTALEIIEDFKLHIMKDVYSPLIYAVYTSSRFNFINPISDELVSELNLLCITMISQYVIVNNNSIWLDFNKLI